MLGAYFSTPKIFATCPDWLGAASIASGPVFRPVSRSGRVRVNDGAFAFATDPRAPGRYLTPFNASRKGNA